MIQKTKNSLQGKSKKNLKVRLIFAVLGVVVLGSLFTINIPTTNAATNTFNQNNWSGSADTNTIATATSGWTKYYSKDALLNALSNALNLVTSLTTGAVITNSSGTNSNTYISGNSVYLCKNIGVACSANQECTSGFCSTTCQTPPCSASTTCGTACGYNGDTYSTVQLSTQCWFRENLRTTQKPDGVTSITRYCYTGDTNCTNTASGMIYGGLYDWATTMNGGGSGAQGICPTGWHIPTDAQWTTLSNSYNGTALQTVSTSAFSGTLAGSYGYGSFFSRDSYGYWWSSTENDASNAWLRLLSSGGSTVYRGGNDKSFGFSVRCLKN